MANWKKSKIYCNGCRTWQYDIKHRNCPRGSSGSLTWLDIDNFQMGCNKCNQTWPLEDNIFYCSCGHVQKTEYTDSAIVLEADDQVIASDGDTVYVLRSSTGVVVVGRSYSDYGYVP